MCKNLATKPIIFASFASVENVPIFSAETGTSTGACAPSQSNIFKLTLLLDASLKDSIPKPGQFYLLRRRPSNAFLFRPISVHAVKQNADGSFLVIFLILKKGTGTKELCALDDLLGAENFCADNLHATKNLCTDKFYGADNSCAQNAHAAENLQDINLYGENNLCAENLHCADNLQADNLGTANLHVAEKSCGTNKSSTQKCAQIAIDLVGPLGNTFCLQDDFDAQTSPSKTSAPQTSAQANAPKKIALIGGGIGIAPIAGFASTIKPSHYDGFASFKTGSYGLDNLPAQNWRISTEDGSVGTKGMLPQIFNEENVANYKAVYACGPTPLLKYVQNLCKSANVKCFLSLEEHMACGVGACLGCTVTTTKGNKRCCKDGPVFAGEEIIF